MKCEYLTVIDSNTNKCALGFYGGRPSIGMCYKCISAKKNSPNFIVKAPSSHKQIKKCCSGTYPKIGKMASTFVKALKDEAISIASGEESIDQNTIDKRIDTCNSCDFFMKKNERCIKCGCFIKLKARMRSQTCPIGKW